MVCHKGNSSVEIFCHSRNLFVKIPPKGRGPPSGGGRLTLGESLLAQGLTQSSRLVRATGDEKPCCDDVQAVNGEIVPSNLTVPDTDRSHSMIATK